MGNQKKYTLNSFRERIKEVRKEAGWDRQEDLGKQAGLNLQKMSAFVNGHNWLTDENVEKVFTWLIKGKPGTGMHGITSRGQLDALLKSLKETYPINDIQDMDRLRSRLYEVLNNSLHPTERTDYLDVLPSEEELKDLGEQVQTYTEKMICERWPGRVHKVDVAVFGDKFVMVAQIYPRS